MNAVMVRTWGLVSAAGFAGGAGVWEKVDGLNARNASRKAAKYLA